jgi:hypothetical protein
MLIVNYSKCAVNYVSVEMNQLQAFGSLFPEHSKQGICDILYNQDIFVNARSCYFICIHFICILGTHYRNIDWSVDCFL